jgi:hypothetical protein
VEFQVREEGEHRNGELGAYKKIWVDLRWSQ